MAPGNALKKFMSWLNAEDDEEEFEHMDTPTLSTQATPPPKRQRGHLTLHENEGGGMEIRHPRSLDDRMAIGMDLKQRRMVTLDLTRLPDADARYFLEFIYGVVFALDATAEKVTDGIYLLAPRGVAVRNDTESEPVAAEVPRFNLGRITGRGAVADEQEELFWQGR